MAKLSGLKPDSTLPADFLRNAVPRTMRLNAKGAKPNASAGHAAVAAAGVPGIDSVQNWVGTFTAAGYDFFGNPQSLWPYSMVGNAPETGRTTTIRSPVIPVTVELLDVNGHLAKDASGAALRNVVPGSITSAVVESPVFEPFHYMTGTTQFNDAEMRSEFWNRFSHGNGDDEDGWHNLLQPKVMRPRTLQLPLGTYAYALNPDGTCCAFIVADLNTFASLLFPPTVPVDNSTPIGAAELAGDMTTHDITTLLFKDVYLADATGCCVIGFHSYDFEPGDAGNQNRERRYVMNYSSWMSLGEFSGGFQDITAFSHEMSETFNDPFGDNATPWWLSVDPFAGYSLCQNNLETGDVIEILISNAVFPIQMNKRTYHPQNEALFSWFAFQSPSRAQNKSYSFPDETTLTTLSAGPLLPGCVKP
jgi:hypothetical protein